MKQRQIIAMGGGGFSMEPDNPLLDEYVLGACNLDNPVISFLPTASGDSDWYTVKFFTAFRGMRCRPKHLPLFRQPPDIDAQVMASDIIYVGGGNTRNMLAIWRASGMDRILRRAWERGIVLCGLSAGAICWFEQGHTDSDGTLSAMDCLGFLPGSCSPHYDGEAQRRPSYQALMATGKLSPGLALDDGVAARFVDTELVEFVSSRRGAKAYRVEALSGKVSETALPTRFLGEADSNR